MRAPIIPGLILFSLLTLQACGEPGEQAVSQDAPAAASQPEALPPAQAPAPVQPGMPSPEFASLPAPYNGADYAAGLRTWKLCQSCHLTAEGAGHLVGPNLHAMFGRKVASAEGFAYSPALAAETFIWTPEQLDNWLQNPRTFVPGNRMSFSGVRRESDRLAVIAYLMVQTGYTGEAEPSE